MQPKYLRGHLAFLAHITNLPGAVMLDGAYDAGGVVAVGGRLTASTA